MEGRARWKGVSAPVAGGSQPWGSSNAGFQGHRAPQPLQWSTQRPSYTGPHSWSHRPKAGLGPRHLVWPCPLAQRQPWTSDQRAATGSVRIGSTQAGDEVQTLGSRAMVPCLATSMPEWLSDLIHPISLLATLGRQCPRVGRLQDGMVQAARCGASTPIPACWNPRRQDLHSEPLRTVPVKEILGSGGA